jgi:hypothetical protein
MAGTPANDLNISQAGLVTFDGVATFLGRSLTAGNGITITNNNGVSGNPTISASGVSVNSFQPNAVLQEFDDFIEPFPSTLPIGGKLQWVSTGNTFGTNGTITNPGIMSMTPAGAGLGIALSLNQPVTHGGNYTISQIALGGGVVSCNWIVQLSSLSSGGNTYRFSCGMADATSVITPTDSFVNGVYFQYTDSVNGGQWTIKSTASSTTTIVNTAIAVGTTFTTLTILVNAGGTSVSYFVNNILVGTAITSNIPTAALTPFFMAINTAGTTPQINVDLFYININLAAPRPGPIFSTVNTGTGMLIRQYRATGISTQVLATDSIIGCTANGLTITMPLASSGIVTGQQWTIKDESLLAGSNPIVINGNGAAILGGNSSGTFAINTNGGSCDLYFNGLNFCVL